MFIAVLEELEKYAVFIKQCVQFFKRVKHIHLKVYAPFTFTCLSADIYGSAIPTEHPIYT